MSIEYRVNSPVSVEQFTELLQQSTLGERRPIQDRECMAGMIGNSNLLISAWEKGELVGIARSLTDFHYACYLSDLAVAETHQKRGIGRQLQIETRNQLGPRCKLILVAAPAANDYYRRLGFENNPRCWILERDAFIEG